MCVITWIAVVLVVLPGGQALGVENVDQAFHRRSTRDAKNYSHAIQPPYDANEDSRFVEMVMVVENTIFENFESNVMSVKRTCMYIASLVNHFMEPLNVFVALTDVVILTEENSFNVSDDANDTLKNFQNYRKNVVSRNHPNDYAVYLHKRNFSGTIVGLSPVGAICSLTRSASIIYYEKDLLKTSSTIAHELGHTLGLKHDTLGCYCPDAYCIMTPCRFGVPNHWSTCSLDKKDVIFKRGNYECLKNVPDKVFIPSYCGNGFLEPGEECDCGFPEYCKNPCCNPYLCVLKENAACATGQCCDISTCSLKNTGEKCRASAGECDLPEHCTGVSEFCPEDVFKRNSEACGDKEAFCYDGKCRTHDSQCQLTRISSAKSSPAGCYSKNTIGICNSDCSYDYLTNKSIPCLPEDEMCGRLHCQNVPKTFDYTEVWNMAFGYSFYESKVVRCHRMSMDLGPQVRDPGLVPNGAKCGQNKMCLNAKCVDIAALRDTFPKCSDCGNGVCNSKGHCHCFEGWGGDECIAPGFGGSPDSGPLSNDKEPRSFTKIMFIIFLGVVPCCAAFAIFLKFWKFRYSQMNGQPYAVSG